MKSKALKLIKAIRKRDVEIFNIINIKDNIEDIHIIVELIHERIIND